MPVSCDPPAPISDVPRAVARCKRSLRAAIEARSAGKLALALELFAALPTQARNNTGSLAMHWVLQASWPGAVAPLAHLWPLSQVVRTPGKARWEEQPALFHAVARGPLAMIDALLAAGANPNQVIPGAHPTPIATALFQNRPEALERLLAAGAVVQLPDVLATSQVAEPNLFHAKTALLALRLMRAGVDIHAPWRKHALFLQGLGSWVLRNPALSPALLAAWRTASPDRDPVCEELFEIVPNGAWPAKRGPVPKMSLAAFAFGANALPEDVWHYNHLPQRTLFEERRLALQRALVEVGMSWDAAAPTGRTWREHALETGYPELRDALALEQRLSALPGIPAAPMRSVRF